MKVLMVNGSPHEEGCTYTALEEVAKALEKAGVETEIMWLGVDAIARMYRMWCLCQDRKRMFPRRCSQ